MSILENANSIEYVITGEFLVIKRFLNVQVNEEDVEQQIENYLS
jgi:hypothetical protein